MVHAQTIPQLYNQLRPDSSPQQLGLLRSTYEFAIRIFSCRYTASGRSFIAHTVGTASILGSLRLPIEVVAAGLLHNAYQNGNFGFGLDRIIGGKRGVVRKYAGKRVEEYVYGFSRLSWNSHAITAVRNSLDRLDEIERHVLLIRLADVLDHHLDSGLGYLGEQERRQFVVRNAAPMIELADSLGYPPLALRLQRAFDAMDNETPRIALDYSLGQTPALLLAPLSLRKQYRGIIIQRFWTYGLFRPLLTRMSG